jgi:hypothetical protein
MKSEEIICDDCEVTRTLRDLTGRTARYIGSVVMYRYANGWVNVPLAGDSIDICPTCDAKKPNLSALAEKVRKRK